MLEPLPNDDLIKCPNCAELIRRNAILCRFCDTGLSIEFFQPCTFCAELIRKEATICRFCRSKLLTSDTKPFSSSSLFDIDNATIEKIFEEHLGTGSLPASAFSAQAHGWILLEQHKKNDEIIKAKISAVTKGGVMVDIYDLRGFVPTSHLRIPHSTPEELLGLSISVKILEMDIERNKLILSQHKAILEETAPERKKILDTIKPGQIVKGKVVRIADFGAFIDLDGIEGLLPISEICCKGIFHPSDVLKVGDIVTTKVLKVDNEKGYIGLSLKQTDFWEGVDKEWAQGSHDCDIHAIRYDNKVSTLQGLESVRRRPGMYIGSTGSRGFHHLLWEIVDNSVDEALSGHCQNISVMVNPDNSITVIDDGRGIPTDTVEKTGTSYIETVFTVLHAGSKFSNDSYKVSGGLHGVGASVVNALSSRLEVEVYRNGHIYRQIYLRGKPVGGLEVIDKTDLHGTKVTFCPDDEIFFEINKNQERNKISVEWDILTPHLREIAFLNKGLTINLRDTRNSQNKSEHFCYANGIADYVEHLNKTLNPLHNRPIYFEQKEGNIVVECALQWTDTLTENIYSFANNINTHDGGTHLMSFYHALTLVINRYARKHGLLKENEDYLSDEDIREGLTAIISIKLPEPQFEGQTKERLGNREVQKHTELIVSIGLMHWLDHNPESAEKITSKCIQAMKARRK